MLKVSLVVLAVIAAVSGQVPEITQEPVPEGGTAEESLEALLPRPVIPIAVPVPLSPSLTANANSVSSANGTIANSLSVAVAGQAAAIINQININTAITINAAQRQNALGLPPGTAARGGRNLFRNEAPPIPCQNNDSPACKQPRGMMSYFIY